MRVVRENALTTSSVDAEELAAAVAAAADGDAAKLNEGNWGV